MAETKFTPKRKTVSDAKGDVFKPRTKQARESFRNRELPLDLGEDKPKRKKAKK